MMQDGQDAPAPSSTTPSRLQVVLLAFDKDAEREAAKDRYTLIRFPQTYEEAIAAVERNLGEHLPGGKAGSMDIFSQMLNSNDEWIWAKADRADWDLVREQLLETGKALGIGRAATPPFIRGPVGLAFREIGSTEWFHIPSTVQILRPRSHLEAREQIATSIITNPNWPGTCTPVWRLNIDDDRLAVANFLARLKFEFYYFLSDPNEPDQELASLLWVDFPEDAEVDEGVWRAFVPAANEVLGFSVSVSERE